MPIKLIILTLYIPAYNQVKKDKPQLPHRNCV